MATPRALAAVVLSGSLMATAAVVGHAAPAIADTATFGYTGGEQVLTVPPGVTQFHVVAVGGRGGAGGAPASATRGGAAAVVTADLAVPAGTTSLFVDVGGRGADSFDPPFLMGGDGGVGGFNGGGTGGALPSASFDVSRAGGGGGASDVRTCSRAVSVCETPGSSLMSRLVVAAGGGGGGGTGGLAGAPGPGGDGGLNGQDGGASTPGTGGGGGGPTAGGAGGRVFNALYPSGDPGGLGVGGAGGRKTGPGITAGPGGGGGGGGLFGGGGGAQGGTIFAPGASGGGGGGSSLVPPGGSVAVDATGVPSITLTFTVPPPGPVTTPPVPGPTASSPAGPLAVTGGGGTGGTVGLVLLVLGGCGIRLRTSARGPRPARTSDTIGP